MSQQTGSASGGTLGEQTKVVNSAFAVSQAASAVSDAAINRLGYNTALVIANVGTVATSFDLKVQDSTDGSTGWADLAVGQFGGVAITQITSANDETTVELEVDLRKAKQYIRLVATVVGAAVINGRSVVLGAPEYQPAA
jgi:hypothetical protein